METYLVLNPLCGFLVLAPTMATAADGIVRRWVDVFWTASKTAPRHGTGKHPLRLLQHAHGACALRTRHAVAQRTDAALLAGWHGLQLRPRLQLSAHGLRQQNPVAQRTAARPSSHLALTLAGLLFPVHRHRGDAARPAVHLASSGKRPFVGWDKAREASAAHHRRAVERQKVSRFRRDARTKSVGRQSAAFRQIDPDPQLAKLLVVDRRRALKRSAAFCVLGKAITSRIFSLPQNSMTQRSSPRAIPACGGAPYAVLRAKSRTAVRPLRVRCPAD